jgi:hypothetical protein
LSQFLFDIHRFNAIVKGMEEIWLGEVLLIIVETRKKLEKDYRMKARADP